MNYPVSKTLLSAIQRLFDDPGVATGLLGQGVPLTERDVACTTSMNALERVDLLRKKIELFLTQMAAELDELGEDELPRLRSEATAMLVVLGEIQSHFPDVVKESD
ncbi:MAG: hypothetical protein JXM70_29995 [Pirellulales bacterium]|nr:hypothetical protein [Pirellulales bacterium]